MSTGQIIQDGDINFYVEVNNGTINFNGKRQVQNMLTSLPQVRLEDIIGREPFLDRLHQELHKTDEIVNVQGIGGVGKTTVAKAFLKKYCSDFKHVAWIQVVEKTKEAFVFNPQLVDNLFLEAEKTNVQEEAYLDHFFELIINRLRELKGNNLLIIDNAGEDMEDAGLHDMLSLQPNWKVLTCSRNQLEGYLNLELNLLPEEDAKALFRYHYKREWDEAKVSELLSLLEYHTLAIEIIAKSSQAQRIGLETLLTRYKKKGIVALNRTDIKVPHNANRKLHNVQQYLLVTLRTEYLSENEKILLVHFSIIPPVNISYEGAISLQTCFDISGEQEREALTLTLNALVGRGWLGWDEANDTFHMHKLTQELIRLELKPDFKKCQKYLYSLYKLTNVNEDKSPPSLLPFAPFAEAALKYIRECRKELVTITNNVGEIYRHTGQYPKAILLLTHAVLLQKKLSNDPFELSIVYNNLAAAHQYFALRNKDISYFMNPPGNLKLAVDRFRNRHIDKSLRYFEKSLEVYPNCPKNVKAKVYINMSQSLREKKDLKKAIVCLLEAKQVYEKEGHSDFFLVVLYNNLATVYEEMNNLGEAIFYMEMSLTILRTHFPGRKFEIGDTLSNLAGIYYNLAKQINSIDILKKSLHTSEQALQVFAEAVGETNPAYASARDIHAWIKLTLEALLQRR